MLICLKLPKEAFPVWLNVVMMVNRESPQKWLVDMNPHVNDVRQRVPNSNSSTLSPPESNPNELEQAGPLTLAGLSFPFLTSDSDRVDCPEQVSTLVL